MIDKLRMRHLKTASSQKNILSAKSQIHNPHKMEGIKELKKAMLTINNLVTSKEELAKIEEKQGFKNEKIRVKRDVILSHAYHSKQTV